MIKENLFSYVGSNTYPGRGIVLGRSQDGKHGVIAYFIMGRSVNSRNRVFVEKDRGIITQAHDPAKLTDPSLVIYAPVRVLGSDTVVTNGDQTDTVYDFLRCEKTFEEALRTRTFEPDAPNYTPRISGLIQVKDKDMTYRLSILKSSDGKAEGPQRFFYEYGYTPKGEGRIIHTYEGDGDPIPSFEGEPRRVALEGDIDAFGSGLWESLNQDNKVSLFVRFIHLATGEWETRIYNKNQ